MDKLGNRELIYQSATEVQLRPIDPIPIRPRETPLDIPVQTYQGKRLTQTSPNATIYINNVYITDDYGTLPQGVIIKEMRMNQILPKANNSHQNEPQMGYAIQGNSRMPLGTVPVEEDGSVYCEAPVGKLVQFQLLDENGMAVQSMRTGTYVHPGEQMSCIGCHENKWEAVPITPTPLATRRAPSTLEPEVGGVYPINFYQLVKAPVFDNKCVPCHIQQNVEPKIMDYASLRPYAFWFEGGESNLIPVYGGSRTTPGKFGALQSRMGKALLNSTHQAALLAGTFTREDMRRVTLWLDCNSDELGAYYDEIIQREGGLVWPVTVDPDNPSGVETRGHAGCMDPLDQEYDPLATINDPRMCLSFVDITKGVMAGTLTVKKIGYNIQVTFPREGDYRFSLADVSGKTVYAGKVEKAARASFSTAGFSQGVYIFTLSTKEGRVRDRLVIME
jgi:hypothetical protein